MNNQLSINIFLTEKFLGKCWHESRHPLYKHSCPKCGDTLNSPATRPTNTDLFTPTGFFLLWEKAQEDGTWMKLKREYWRQLESHIDFTPDLAINPLTFPTLLAEYLGWKDNN